ncbi:MAG: hypothetical protein Q9160_009365, partial [Pyrenula sp. 1 TL-2023]
MATQLNKNPADHERPRVFRIQDVPASLDKDTLEEALRSYFHLNKNSSLKMYSLVPDPYDSGTFVATVTSAGKPMLSPGYYELVGKQIKIDDKFMDFTPLSSPPPDQDYDFDVIALPGMGGHAFVSFMVKDEHGIWGFMWLRDELPNWLPKARVMVYGYDAKLKGSKSKQTIANLGEHFKNSLTTMRNTDRDPQDHGKLKAIGPEKCIVPAFSATHGRSNDEERTPFVRSIDRPHNALLNFEPHYAEPQLRQLLELMREIHKKAPKIIKDNKRPS